MADNKKSTNSGYALTRDWFDFVFENPGKVNTNHTALFTWLVELNNRLGWVSEFGITAGECMSAMGCKSYKTYKSSFDDLVRFNFVTIVKKSINQYQCNIIALVKNTNTHTKALDKALTNHLPKQVQSTYQSTSHIHLNQETNKHLNHELWESKKIEIKNSQRWIEDNAKRFNLSVEEIFKELEDYFLHIETMEKQEDSEKNLKQYFANRLNIKQEKEKNSAKKENGNSKIYNNDRSERVEGTKRMGELAEEVLRQSALKHGLSGN